MCYHNPHHHNCSNLQHHHIIVLVRDFSQKELLILHAPRTLTSSDIRTQLMMYKSTLHIFILGTFYEAQVSLIKVHTVHAFVIPYKKWFLNKSLMIIYVFYSVNITVSNLMQYYTNKNIFEFPIWKCLVHSIT